jgi:hypothetical protein
MKHLITLSTLLAALIALAGPSEAQTEKEKPQPSFGFVEAAGVWGLQFGEQQYLPDGAPADRKHPMTNGPGFNITAGYSVLPGLDIIVDYTYASARSRTGDIAGALDGVTGSIDYQTIEAGLRSGRKLGPGKLYGELALGVVLPFQTELEYEYAPEMSAIGVSGIGTKTDSYNSGLGAHGELGYQFPVWEGMYLSTAARISGFETNNDGDKTVFENFVADFTQPQPLDMTVRYSTSSGEAPTTYSVQDLRLHVSLGYSF